MREMVAAFIAMEMDIPTPEPAIVNISNDLVEASVGSWHYQRLNKSKGINFGSSLLGHAPELSIHAVLNATQAKDAQHVLSFDILLRHFDRRADKPNLLSDGERLYVIDHELAFGFVFEFRPNQTPWILTEADLMVLPNHLLYHKVKQSAFNVEDSVERLERLTDEFWIKAWNELPDEWQCDQFHRIKDEITLVREHAEEFYERLKHQLP